MPERRLRSSFETCKHGHQAPRTVLDDLPASQAGTGRHKCAICAFEAGVDEGRRLALAETVKRQPSSS
jgi:hypothetical protein